MEEGTPVPGAEAETGTGDGRAETDWSESRSGLEAGGGGIVLRVNGRGDGFVLSGAGAAVRIPIWDQAFDCDDHGDGLDLGGHAVSRHFGVQVGDFPEAVQDSLAAQVPPAQFLRFLLHALFVYDGLVLEHVVANTGFGFGIGGGVRVKADGFGGLAVVHGSRENQMGKSYFLIGDGVADLIFEHEWFRFSGSCEVVREKLCVEVSDLREAQWVCVTPDSVMSVFRFLVMPKS
jgi:hypothetical protein